MKLHAALAAALVLLIGSARWPAEAITYNVNFTTAATVTGTITTDDALGILGAGHYGLEPINQSNVPDMHGKLFFSWA